MRIGIGVGGGPDMYNNTMKIRLNKIITVELVSSKQQYIIRKKADHASPERTNGLSSGSSKYSLCKTVEIEKMAPIIIAYFYYL